MVVGQGGVAEQTAASCHRPALRGHRVIRLEEEEEEGRWLSGLDYTSFLLALWLPLLLV